MTSTNHELHPRLSASLQKLVDVLITHGYSEFLNSSPPFGAEPQRWRLKKPYAGQPLQSLLDLFLLSKATEISSLPVELAELIPDLSKCGLLEQDQGVVNTRGLSLMVVMGRWLFSQQLTANPTLYFGYESEALMRRLVPKQKGVVFDLCSGPGAQALHCSGFSDQIYAVEINPFSHALARLNIAMNDLEECVHPLLGDLYEPLDGLKADFIVANPPLIAFPEEVFYPFVGHGGNDGLKITRRILSGVSDRLQPEGRVQIIGTCFSDSILPLVIDDLEQIALRERIDCTLTVTAQLPLSPGAPYFEALIRSAISSNNSLSKDDATLKFSAFLRSQGATHMAFYFLMATPGSGELSLLDISQEDSSSYLWYS